MKLYVNVLKHLFTALLFTGISLQAAPVIAEQILTGNGGDSVAISAEWAFVGDKDECDVYVYKFDYVTNLWGDGAGTAGAEHSIISEGPCTKAAFKGFGAAVSTSNQLLVVGAPEAKTGSSQHGKIFFYTLVNDVWTLNDTIGTAEDNGTDDTQHLAEFGEAVSVRHSGAVGEAILLVGAPNYDTGTDIDAGKAYMYLWNDASETISLVGSVEGENAYDGFGTNVTSNGIRFIVSAPYFGSVDKGKVYLYDFNSDLRIFGEHQTFSSGDGNIPILEDNQHLGTTLSLNIHGNMLLGGQDTLVLKRGNSLYSYAHTLENTQEADVSQSGTLAGVGYTDRSVSVYSDYAVMDGIPDLNLTKNETNYGWDISLSDSRLMVNGETNNQAYAYYSPCGQGGTLEAMKWTMIGLQCDVDGAPISEIFSDLDGAYDTNWVVYKQNGTDYEGHQNAYVKLAATDTMELGVGYWIISDTNATWQIQDTISTAVTSTPSIADPYTPIRDSIGAVYPIDLITVTQNRSIPDSDIKVMLSNPYPFAIPWGETLFQGIGGSFYLNTLNTFFEDNATVAYVVNSATGGYTPISTITPGVSGEIGAGEGFYIRLSQEFDNVVQSGATLFNLLISVEK